MGPKINFAIFLFSVLLTFTACSTDVEKGNEVTAITVDPDKSIAEIIKSPVDANQPVDTVNVAKMTFEETRFNFGSIEEEEVVSHVFKFTNTGKVPLLINDARSTCGCTVPDWPKNPIEPGEGGEIAVRFDSKGKNGRQSKPITITANTYPNQSVLHIDGNVIPKKQTN